MCVGLGVMGACMSEKERDTMFDVWVCRTNDVIMLALNVYVCLH